MIFERVGPTVLLSQSLQDLMHEVPGLRDGDERAIHQSRVAIRRMREAAALAQADYDEDEFAALESRLVKAFKALGRARDADTAHRLVQDVESRFPMAAATLGQLRASIGRTRQAARRRLIKKLESLEVEALPAQLDHARLARRRLSLGRPPWQGMLRSHIVHRARDLRDAIERAGGVYFRRRSHDARIAIKQLRYALELGLASRVQPRTPRLRPLRKTQDALGQAHDREVLLERLHNLEAEGASVRRDEVLALEQFVQGEISALHEKYLAARPQLLDVCAACESPRGQRPIHLGAIAAAVAIPVLLARYNNHRQP